jgi:hypothetical protein
VFFVPDRTLRRLPTGIACRSSCIAVLRSPLARGRRRCARNRNANTSRTSSGRCSGTCAIILSGEESAISLSSFPNDPPRSSVHILGRRHNPKRQSLTFAVRSRHDCAVNSHAELMRLGTTRGAPQEYRARMRHRIARGRTTETPSCSVVGRHVSPLENHPAP